MQWSIATTCLGGTLEAKLLAAAKAGFHAVEIFENDLTFFSGKPKDVRRMAEDLGLSIVTLQPFRDFEGMPEPQRSRNFERAERKFDLMHELGTDLLFVCSNVSPEVLPDLAWAITDLGELADRAVQHGFRVGYEALSWGREVKDWMTAWEIVKRANRPNLGVVLDSFHTFVRKNPVEPIAQIPGNRIYLIQVADSPDLLMDPLSLSRHYRCMPGQGEYRITEFLQAVASTGYEGAISLEVFNDQFRGASTAQVATDGMRSLKWYFDRLNLPLSNTPSPREALLGVPKIEHLEFVEFAAGESDAHKLTGWLEGLGFHLAGRHRSKAVKLYRQNDINLVLNLEPDSFAQNFYAQHGPSVCAIALAVDNSQRAVARARALGAETHQGRIGPGEANIPAVKGIEGSPIYFVDAAGPSNWETDFVMEKTQQEGLLLRVDHLSNVVQRWEFLSWLLFYKSVLGFEEEPQVELADPYGAFYSRSVRSPDGSVRIPLNIGDGGSTAVSRFLTAFGGAGVQHIALQTSNIFAFAAQAKAKGVRFLEIPPNYYHDLGARFGLDDGLLQQLRQHHILYDRHKDGEFFQLYTATFENRFFFEVVERRSYDLLGAANTPVRLAAQAREYEAGVS